MNLDKIDHLNSKGSSAVELETTVRSKNQRVSISGRTARNNGIISKLRRYLMQIKQIY